MTALPPPDAPECPHARLRISTTSGSVTVIAEERADVTVDRGGQAETLGDGGVEVRAPRPSASVVVRCPVGTDLVVGTSSGGVELVGRFGSVSVTSASGSIRTQSVTEADLRTTSGTVGVGECAGRCRVSTKSGTVNVLLAGEADISSVAGTITIEEVDGTVEVRTVSGTVTVGANGKGPVDARTMSGAITIRLPRGLRPAVRMSGRRSVETECEAGNDVNVDVSTISGAVRILPV